VLGKSCCVLQGEAQLGGTKFAGCVGDVLKLGQGAFLDRPLVLRQQNTLKDSHSLVATTKAVSASDLLSGLKQFSGAFLSRAAGCRRLPL